MNLFFLFTRLLRIYSITTVDSNLFLKLFFSILLINRSKSSHCLILNVKYECTLSYYSLKYVFIDDAKERRTFSICIPSTDENRSFF